MAFRLWRCLNISMLISSSAIFVTHFFDFIKKNSLLISFVWSTWFHPPCCGKENHNKPNPCNNFEKFHGWGTLCHYWRALQTPPPLCHPIQSSRLIKRTKSSTEKCICDFFKSIFKRLTPWHEEYSRPPLSPNQSRIWKKKCTELWPRVSQTWMDKAVFNRS